jgi:hypothetical protein
MFAARAADRTPRPDSSPGRPAADTGKPSRSGRLLTLLRKLVDYGKELAGSLRRRNTLDYDTAICFGSADLQSILQRITQGLHRAAELEARIIRSAVRLDRQPTASRDAPAKPCAAHAARPSAEPTDPRKPTEPADARLARLATPAAIAAAVRRRPIGAVLADICRDLGIMPSHPLWHDLHRAIMTTGGDAARLLMEEIKRPFAIPVDDRLTDLVLPADMVLPWAMEPPPSVSAAARPP